MCVGFKGMTSSNIRFSTLTRNARHVAPRYIDVASRVGKCVHRGTRYCSAQVQLRQLSHNLWHCSSVTLARQLLTINIFLGTHTSIIITVSICYNALWAPSLSPVDLWCGRIKVFVVYAQHKGWCRAAMADTSSLRQLRLGITCHSHVRSRIG